MGGKSKEGDMSEILQNVHDKIQSSINQSDAVIKVTRWFPGVLDNFVGEDNSSSATQTPITKQLLDEAQQKLDKSEHLGSRKDEIMKGPTGMGAINENEGSANGVAAESSIGGTRPGKKIRFKTVSTPVGGGDFFTPPVDGPLFQPAAPVRPRRRVRTMSTPMSGDMFNETSTVDKLGSGNPLTLVELEQSTTFEGQYLEGFVRRKGRSRSVSNLSWTTEEKTTEK